MDFYPDQLFHIYNQGNNRRAIFFEDENYSFFLWKIRGLLLPFGDIISYCLMPNHFHLQFYVRETEIARSLLRDNIDRVEYLRRVNKYGDKKALTVKFDANRSADPTSLISLNDAIGILQSSYSVAINKKNDWSGSLFRASCHAKDGWDEGIVTLKKSNGQIDNRFMAGNDFGYQCMVYIHNNPVKAKLVESPEEWEFSSAKDYAGLRNGTLCNLKLGRSILNFI